MQDFYLSHHVYDAFVCARECILFELGEILRFFFSTWMFQESNLVTSYSAFDANDMMMERIMEILVSVCCILSLIIMKL
jgi:hypothetical protein